MGKIIIAKLCTVLIFMLLLSSIFASPNNPPLNQVMLQLQAEKWAVASTAKVIVNVNASLANADLANIHAQIMQNLQKVAPKADWHITHFNRSQGQSGLEQLNITAQTRLPENALANLRQQAEKVSKPGEKYTIVNILFTPSLQEIQTVEQQLRAQLYTQAYQEMQRLNKTFSDQHFVLHNISFVNAPATPAMPMMNTLVMQKGNGGATPLSVSDKVILNATVVFAASMQSEKISQ